MATFLFDKIIFGPVNSRRLGTSLGINLAPTTEKRCNFNCIYCECGFSKPWACQTEELPPKDVVLEKLKEVLQEFHHNHKPIDAITFAGNGEPTLHPDFYEIMKGTVEARNAFFPKAEITVLTNAAGLENNQVKEALLLIDKPLFKLDAGTANTFALINNPVTALDLNKIIDGISHFPGKRIVQTMFLRYRSPNLTIDNTTEAELSAWLEHLKKISPREVMLYSIARDTPTQNIIKITQNELESIGIRVKEKLGDVVVNVY